MSRNILILTLLSGCLLRSAALVAAEDSWLENLLRSQPERFATVMKQPDVHRVQIIYTQIDRDPAGKPAFRSFSYRLDADEYFYPASTVKLPVAALALERLRELDIAGLDAHTTMLTQAARPEQSAVVADETAAGNLPTVAHYVRKILLVSDNDAYNRLYEFLGQAPLNTTLHAKGYTGSRIMHRLELVRSIEENRHTNPVRFVAGDKTVYEQAARYSDIEFTADTPVRLGVAEIVAGERIDHPKDFAEKNALPLQELHDIVKALVFPASVPAQRRFNLEEKDYELLYRNMSAYPGDSGIAAYEDAEKYPEGYVKFLMYGGNAERIPDHIRIYNKVGDAYGFLTDAAYIADLRNNLEFLLAATIYTNANGTFNDNQYEYDEIGFPFLRELGQAIYEYELSRERANDIDFSWLE